MSNAELRQTVRGLEAVAVVALDEWLAGTTLRDWRVAHKADPWTSAGGLIPNRKNQIRYIEFLQGVLFESR